MSEFSDFRQSLKVDMQTTKERKYGSSEIVLREDNQTGKIGIYINKKVESREPEDEIGNEGEIRRVGMVDINIEDSHVIPYDLVISPLGHFAHKEYWHPMDKKRYGKIYSLEDVLGQVEGEKDYNKIYTENELIELREKINRERKEAKYFGLCKVKYADSYKGKRLLEGKHIASTVEKRIDGLKVWKWICVEDENILIRVDKKNNLIIKLNGKREKVSQTKYHTNLIKLPYPTSVRDASFEGFTIKAFANIIQNQEKEKGEREYE